MLVMLASYPSPLSPLRVMCGWYHPLKSFCPRGQLTDLTATPILKSTSMFSVDDRLLAVRVRDDNAFMSVC